MEDEKIVSLFLNRQENAITECKSKYHSFLVAVSFNILRNKEDSEECVNDTYLGAWQKIPPEKPKFLRAFLSKITRNLSLNKLRFYSAEKRGGSEALRFVQTTAAEILVRNYDEKMLLEETSQFDDECIKRNISPGGAADLLALTLMIHKITTQKER